MKRLVALASLLILGNGCGYWSAPVTGDTAPGVWTAPRTPAVPSSESVPSSSRPASVEERLHNLEQLRRQGVISDAEYRERRRKAVDSF